MDNRQGSAAPWYSPDGRWYWDGSAWRPVVYQAAHTAPPHHWRPGRKFYLAAVLAVSLAALLVTLGVRGFVTGFPMNAIRVTAPGTDEITLTAPGTYTISYERQDPPAFPDPYSRTIMTGGVLGAAQSFNDRLVGREVAIRRSGGELLEFSWHGDRSLPRRSSPAAGRTTRRPAPRAVPGPS